MAYGALTQGQALRRQGQTTAAYDLLIQAAHLAQAARNDHPQHVALLVDIEYRAYSWLFSIALSNADYAQARAYAAAQLALCQRFEKTIAPIMALFNLCDIHRELGDFRLVRYYAEEALAATRKVNYRPGEAVCFEHLAVSTWAQGDCGEALQLYKQLLVIYQEAVHPLERASNLPMLARLYSRLGANDRAQAAIEESFRLLTALNFPAQETLAATWTRCWLAYQSGDLTQAQADAEQGLTMARQNYGATSQAYGLTLLGLVYESRHQAAAAKSAYQEALTTYVTLESPLFAVEPRAGLARLALSTGDPAGAQAEIEAILPILQQEPLAGFDEPFQVYWSCYSVLAANHDPRAVTLLQTAKQLLGSYVERIPEPALRQSFLGNVPVHRALWQAD